MSKIHFVLLLTSINIYTLTMGLVAHKFSTEINVSCIQCLCHVNGCDLTKGCTYGYCGPFQISRAYWINAEKPTLPYDDPKKEEAFESCTNDYQCSVRTIKNYIRKYGKDCNSDGRVDCEDFVMMHFYQDEDCFTPLFLTSDGLRWLERFEKCHTLKTREELLLQSTTFNEADRSLGEGLNTIPELHINREQYEEAVNRLERQFKRIIKALKEEKNPLNLKIFNKFSSELSKFTNSDISVPLGNKKIKYGHKKRSRISKLQEHVKKPKDSMTTRSNIIINTTELNNSKETLGIYHKYILSLSQ